MEDGIRLRLPVHHFMETLPLDAVQHKFEQVQFDRLLDEHHIVLRHGWRNQARTQRGEKKTNMVTTPSKLTHSCISLREGVRRRDMDKLLTEAVVVGRLPGVRGRNGAEDLRSTEISRALLLLRIAWGRHADDVVEEAWKDIQL